MEIELLQYALLGTVIAGITELINRLRSRDYWAAATISCAALVGGLFGLYGVEGLTVITGIAAGLGTSGTITAISAVKSITAPRNALRK